MLKISKEFSKINQIKIANIAKIIGATFSIGTSLIVISFETGRIVQQNSFAKLKLYDSITLTADKLIEDIEIILEEKAIKLEQIILVEADRITQRMYPNQEVYFIHKRAENPLEVRKIGTITTNKTVKDTNRTLEKILKLPGKILEISELSTDFSFIEKAYAHTPNIFQWHGYENKHNYYERYIQRYLIERTYRDGAVLQYKMNLEGYSIPSTFKWIKLPNHNH